MDNCQWWSTVSKFMFMMFQQFLLKHLELPDQHEINYITATNNTFGIRLSNDRTTFEEGWPWSSPERLTLLAEKIVTMDPGPKTISRASCWQDPMKLKVLENFMTTVVETAVNMTMLSALFLFTLLCAFSWKRGKSSSRWESWRYWATGTHISCFQWRHLPAVC